MGDIADDPSAHHSDDADKYDDQQSDCPWKAPLSVPFHGFLPYRFLTHGIQNLNEYHAFRYPTDSILESYPLYTIPKNIIIDDGARCNDTAVTKTGK